MFREVFIPKATAETAATAVSALCFFSLPNDGVYGGKQVYAYVLHVIHKQTPQPHNHCTRYNGKPLYRVQQNHQLRDTEEITPSGNSLAH